MTKGRLLALIAAIGLLLGALVYGSFSIVQTQCDLCVEYHGTRTCRTGSGVDEEEAQRAAQRAACAVMAFGMSESINCERTIPTNVQCR